MKQIVAFSGGVDSTALALAMPDATPVFTDTGWEFPHVYDHIARFEQVTGREVVRIVNEKYPGGIPEYIRHSKFMPNHGARWCTERFKITPMNKWLKAHLPATLNIALRADEPQRTGNTTDMPGLTIAYPLREWGMTRMDVVQVCVEHDLLPRYPVYAARGGCKGCFYKRKSELVAMQQLIPDVVDELRELEEEVQDERGAYFHMFPAIGTSIAGLQAQPPLFDMAQVYADAANTSDYGENCGLFCNR
jgi:hypothetical protein